MKHTLLLLIFSFSLASQAIPQGWLEKPLRLGLASCNNGLPSLPFIGQSKISDFTKLPKKDYQATSIGYSNGIFQMEMSLSTSSRKNKIKSCALNSAESQAFFSFPLEFKLDGSEKQILDHDNNLWNFRLATHSTDFILDYKRSLFTAQARPAEKVSEIYVNSMNQLTLVFNRKHNQTFWITYY